MMTILFVYKMKLKGSSHQPNKKKNANCVLRSHVEGLVEAVSDNFDTDISLQNGKMQTHSLSLLMTQPITKKWYFLWGNRNLYGAEKDGY